MNVVVDMSIERGFFLLLLVGCLFGCDGYDAGTEEESPEGHPLGTLTMLEREFIGDEVQAIIDV